MRKRAMEPDHAPPSDGGGVSKNFGSEMLMPGVRLAARPILVLLAISVLRMVSRFADRQWGQYQTRIILRPSPSANALASLAHGCAAECAPWDIARLWLEL